MCILTDCPCAYVYYVCAHVCVKWRGRKISYSIQIYWVDSATNTQMLHEWHIFHVRSWIHNARPIFHIKNFFYICDLKQEFKNLAHWYFFNPYMKFEQYWVLLRNVNNEASDAFSYNWETYKGDNLNEDLHVIFSSIQKAPLAPSPNIHFR